MITLDWTLLAAGAVFLLTLWALNSFLFRPLFRILDERRSQTVETQRRASEKIEYRKALAAEYENKLKEERKEGYRLAEAIRHEALEQRQLKLSQTKAQAQERLTKTRQEIQQDIESAKADLQRSAEEMSLNIAHRILEKR